MRLTLREFHFTLAKHGIGHLPSPPSHQMRRRHAIPNPPSGPTEVSSASIDASLEIYIPVVAILGNHFVVTRGEEKGLDLRPRNLFALFKVINTAMFSAIELGTPIDNFTFSLTQVTAFAKTKKLWLDTGKENKIENVFLSAASEGFFDKTTEGYTLSPKYLEYLCSYANAYCKTFFLEKKLFEYNEIEKLVLFNNTIFDIIDRTTHPAWTALRGRINEEATAIRPTAPRRRNKHTTDYLAQDPHRWLVVQCCCIFDKLPYWDIFSLAEKYKITFVDRQQLTVAINDVTGKEIVTEDKEKNLSLNAKFYKERKHYRKTIMEFIVELRELNVD
jgi:hypothetical protein